jgi:hypothetical protein
MARTAVFAAARIALATVIACTVAAPVFADGFWWHGVRDGVWNHGKKGPVSNWYNEAPAAGMPRGVPRNTANFAVGAVTTTVDFTRSAAIGTIRFFPDVEPYTFNVSTELLIDGDGIINKAGTAPTFIVDEGGPDVDPRLRFLGSAVIVGQVLIENIGFGETRFEGQSMGGAAVVTSNDEAKTIFLDESSADRMVITNDGISSTHFRDNSTGGQAEFLNNARLDFSPTRGPGNTHEVTAGSIANTGTLDIGKNTLMLQKRLNLKPGGRLMVDVNQGKSGFILVNRDAKLGGQLQLSGDGLTKRTRVVLLRALGARIGKFETVDFGTLTLRNARIDYQGNDVVLLLDPLPPM